jgi:outer membrane usher protein
VSTLIARATRLAALFLLALLTPALVAAQDQRALLEIVVNEMPSGESLVVLRGNDVLIPTATLTKAGLSGFKGRRDVVAGEEFVSLASLAADVSFSVNELELRLSITANPALLGRTIRDLASGAPSDLVYRRDTSSYVNYAVNWHTGNHVDLVAESATSYKGASIYNTLSATERSTTRGLSSVTIDQRHSMRRWTMGDNLGYTGALGGDAWVGGVTVTKEYSINPYYVRYPTLSLSTPIAVPSVLEVQVNGQTVSQERVDPGRLDIRNLPLTLGRNDARIIVRDAFGQTRELSSNYYVSSSALTAGTHDYQYSFGLQRFGVGEKNWDYRAPVLLARHRVGITDSFTAGARFEGRRDVLSGGPSINLRLPFGEIETAVAGSRLHGQWANAQMAAFTYASRPVTAGGSVTRTSPHYTTLTPNPPGQTPKTQANVFASTSVAGPLTVTLQHSLTQMWEGTERKRTGLLTSLHLNRYLEMNASASYGNDERGRVREAYVGLSVLFGRASATAAHLVDSRGGRMTFDAQQPLPVGEGYGYQLHADNGPVNTSSGVARYQNAHGRYEVRQETIGTATTTTVSAMGGIVGIGGGLYATRPVQESFALVRVPGVQGVRAFASHQEIGKTGRSGDVLIPDLQAYYGNILNIADGDIPIQYSVGDAGMTLAPPYRGGAVARFDVQMIQRVIGRLKLVSGAEEHYQVYGELTVTSAAGRSYGSPVGSDGTFYFENLPTGPYTAAMEYRGTRCVFTLDVPASTNAMLDLGTVRCSAETRP